VDFIIPDGSQTTGSFLISHFSDGLGNSITAADVAVNADGTASGTVNAQNSQATSSDSLNIAADGTSIHNVTLLGSLVAGYAGQVTVGPAPGSRSAAHGRFKPLFGQVIENTTINDGSGNTATVAVDVSGSATLTLQPQGGLAQPPQSLGNINSFNATTLSQ